jgi:hypothetical protein
MGLPDRADLHARRAVELNRRLYPAGELFAPSLGFDLADAGDMTHPDARLAQLVLAIGFTIIAAGAHAQSASHIGLGAGVNLYRPTSTEAHRSEGVGVEYRWHSFHSGWGPTFGLDWHKTGFTQPLGPIDTPLGTIQFRTILLGIGHTQHMRRLNVSASLSGGYAMNRLALDSRANPTFELAGVSLVAARARNSAAAKPEVSVWFDIAKRLGVGVSAAYFVARPDVIIETSTGSYARRLRADALELHAGMTIGVWKDR